VKYAHEHIDQADYMNIKKTLLIMFLSVFIFCGLLCALGIIGVAGTTGEKAQWQYSPFVLFCSCARRYFSREPTGTRNGKAHAERST